MPKLQLPRNPFVKDAPENHSFFTKPVSRRMRGTGTSPVPVIFPASRAAWPGKTSLVRGVHVADILDLPVVQQPERNERYVSPMDGQVTEFGIPAKFGNVGLLAHNDLSGRFFSRLAPGQGVHLVYGNARIETFVITDVLRYQALQPDNPYSAVRDLGTNKFLTAAQLFEKAYMGSRHVTFQTCISAYGSLAWGRLFVLATHTNHSGPNPWN